MLGEGGESTNGRLLETWEDYYRQSDSDTILKDRNFFRLEVETIRDALQRHAPQRPLHIVELGCGTGFLAEFLRNSLVQEQGATSHYVGVDFSGEAVAKARSRQISNVEFVQADFLTYVAGDLPPVDVFIVQRSIMALIDKDQQRALLSAMKTRLAVDGIAILSEGTGRGFASLNALRERTGQSPLEDIWHCLYVDEEMVREVFDQVTIQDFSSTYWLITRVIYPYGRQPEHNTPIHDLAAQLPQVGEYGLVKLILAR